MKNSLAIVLIAFVAVFTSCDKGDMEVQKLNRGEGVWEIESVRYDFFNAVGTSIDSSRTMTNPAEFVFFNATTLNALFDEHLMVVNENNSNGTVTAYPGGIYYDDNRAKISTGSTYDGVWTVVDNGRRKQEWALYTVNTNGNLSAKATLFLKKK